MTEDSVEKCFKKTLCCFLKLQHVCYYADLFRSNIHLFCFLGFKEKRPWNWLPLDRKLNTNQREVIKRILAPGDTSSPLVVFGPFGTGKTFTLNQAIRHLVTKQHNRILLCTHTNSAADIHVRLLHDHLKKENVLKATKPLRIYQTNRRSVNFENL